MNPALTAFLACIGMLMLGIGFLGLAGRSVPALTRAPLLDLVVAYFTILPWVVGMLIAGWAGLPVAVAVQVLTLVVWCWMHEASHPQARHGPRIVTTLNRITGRWRNHAALWITTIVVPVFWAVRLGEVLVYPLLTLTVGLPRYRHGEWVNVSRHKFEGLVGHDLIWCLYCDWMTGVWSLGSEMLRNVESFWCPIRFYDGKKCENCRLDFPDIDNGWVAADATMAEVADVLEHKYGSDRREWFGHPARLTIEGRASTERQ
jgi:hypothetical protein